MSEKEHIERLIVTHQRRLQKLEERQAVKGINADPEILIEIEDLKAEIEKLHAQRDGLFNGAETPHRIESLEEGESLPQPGNLPKEFQSESGKSGSTINIVSNEGQIAFGKNISQVRTVSDGEISAKAENSSAQSGGVIQPQARDVYLTALRQILANLKLQVEAEAPPEMQDAALERATELEEAITAIPPDLDTMAYINRWFAKNIPSLAGAVTEVITDPIMGKLMVAIDEVTSVKISANC